MCTVCGCSEGEVQVEDPQHSHTHKHDHAHHSHEHHSHEHPHNHTHHHHEHDHSHEHPHDHSHDEHSHVEHTEGSEHHHYGHGPAHAHAPGMSQARMVQIEQDILGKNNQYASANRQWLAERGILALNLVSSPGSGKTTLLTRTINDLKESQTMTVIEGDQQTVNDAERIRATGAKALQINTGKGCHLDGHMVGHALEKLQPENDSILFIENVGNLVCPASFDLGEAHKVAILSVTEGEDKPLKYPDMFHAADVMLLNKTDLLPYLQFDVDACIANARRVNPKIRVIQVSATTGEGMDTWYSWLTATKQLVGLGQ